MANIPKTRIEKNWLNAKKKFKLIAIRCRLTMHVAVAICNAWNSIANDRNREMILVKNVTDTQQTCIHTHISISMEIFFFVPARSALCCINLMIYIYIFLHMISRCWQNAMRQSIHFTQLQFKHLYAQQQQQQRNYYLWNVIQCQMNTCAHTFCLFIAINHCIYTFWIFMNVASMSCAICVPFWSICVMIFSLWIHIQSTTWSTSQFVYFQMCPLFFKSYLYRYFKSTICIGNINIYRVKYKHFQS